jgi:uncharacterized SAM-binding protein YcdF (DUF218 family)
MFFFLSKILDLLITPINWVFFLLLFCVLTKNIKIKKYGLVAAVTVLYLCSNYIIVNNLLKLWENDPVKIADNSVFDVAIVLTGITDNTRSPQDRIYLNKGAERITTPIILHRKGIIKKILISGGTGSTNAKAEADILSKFLQDNGIPINDIIVENQSRNTRENALFTKKKLSQYPQLKSKLLITSSFHMNRSIACFNKIDIKCTPYPVDFYSSNSNTTIAKVFIPHAASLNYCTKLIHEVSGYIVYKFVGYL